ncbi:glycosyltransferase family 4 protein [Vibrio tritonius]|uniref:Glycosyltransferase family 4 protein n=1 Tax=Vibrio tritonius TaxID=1435069 RepID=A0ABS7YJ65_9VIBR|nr:glycosyltransferase family 4 protein [Vibrio tritonius]MCA2015719.1 glycosyltransferase family 4 protein [Vibrio tritonius]
MNETIAITANTSWYVYNFRKNTILALLENNYKVVIISPFDEYAEKLTDLGVKHIHINIDSNGMNPIKDILTFMSFLRIFKKEKVNLILNFTPKNNIYSTLAGKINKVKVINNIAGLGRVFIDNSILTKLVKVLYKLSQKHADFIFFQNNEDMEVFVKNNLVKKDYFEVIPGSGVDLKRFKYSHKNEKNNGKIKFLLMSRLLWDKGIKQYVEAAKECKLRYGDQVDFYLMGFIKDNKNYVDINQISAWENDGYIKYLGSSDNVEKIISDKDCMVLPSFYREGVPKSLLEAGAMGKPIITTNNVGCREVVDDEQNGYLCEPKSTESLTNAIIKFIELCDEKKLIMGINSRKKIEQSFDEKIILQKYMSKIEDIINGMG